MTKPSAAPPLVCLYEDRPYQIPGVKLLLLTLRQHCPHWPVRLRFPEAPAAFRKWLRGFPQVRMVEGRLPASGSYNVKPAILLEGLVQAAECLWFDTDILLTGGLPSLESQPIETIIVTQDPWEYPDGSTHRCDSWRLAAGRSLPGPLNSAVVRVTRHHAGLLEAWNDLVSTPAYLAEQARPVAERDPHRLGDQDALSALLASERFRDLPVRRLRHAYEILQHHGAGSFSAGHRWATLRHGLPPLLHAMGSVKPWRMKQRPSLRRTPRDLYERCYLEVSPYVHVARQYRAALEEEDTQWLDLQTLPGRFESWIAFNQPSYKGTLQAVMHRLLFSRTG